MEKFVDKAILMCCKLGELWSKGDFESRQKLQNLMFPNGILLNKENSNYRTENENEVFKAMRLLDQRKILRDFKIKHTILII